MPVGSVEEVRGALFEAYDGFADKRLKDLGRDQPFIVDDRGKGDLDAQGRLFLWFCQILAHVEASDWVRITLRGGVPEGAGVTEWFQAHGAQHSNSGLEVIVTPADVGDLEAPAKAFLAITKSRYEVAGPAPGQAAGEGGDLSPPPHRSGAAAPRSLGRATTD